MSLNHTTLTDEQKESLFRHHLHLIGQTENTETAPDFKIKGNRNSGIIWMIDEATDDFLNEADSALLVKILQACKLTDKDIAIINRFGSNLSPDTIANQLNAHTLILSGLPEPKADPLTNSFYQVLERNDLKMIRIDSLETIGKDPSLKTRLWNCLRQLFNL